MKFNIYKKKVDATVHTMEAKVKAVVDAPTPTVEGVLGFVELL